MTPQEQQLLTQLTQRINQTQLQEKDPDAENLLGRELGANPDALYILAQIVLVQDIALQQARAQVQQLQQQVQQAQQQHAQPAHSTSFLGRLLGDREPEQLVPQPPQQSAPQPPPYQPVQPPPYGGPQYQQFPPQYTGAPAGQPSFLRGAMQTAAGVAAGALAFEGVESILHGFGHGGGMGMAGFGMGPASGMMGGFDRPVEETVVNNYYDTPASGHDPNDGTLRGFDDNGQGTRDDQGGQGLTDTGYNAANDQNLTDDSAAYDNSVDDVQLDNSGQDDGGGFDDSGSGFDDGGGLDNSGGDF